MAKLERDVEKRFFDIITKQEDNPSSNAYKVYQKLVYYRFEEIIKNSFPEFIKHISINELEKSLYEFLKKPPSTPFVWKIANDYRKFVKKQKLFHNKKYLYELLYFDWIEVEILMKEYKFRKNTEFSWNESYKLSSSARIKKFNFDILNGQYEIKRENFLVSYYDFSRDEVLFRELNEFLFVLLKKLNKKQTLKEVLKLLCKENEINFKEAKELLEDAIKELFSLNIIVKS